MTTPGTVGTAAQREGWPKKKKKKKKIGEQLWINLIDVAVLNMQR